MIKKMLLVVLGIGVLLLFGCNNKQTEINTTPTEVNTEAIEDSNNTDNTDTVYNIEDADDVRIYYGYSSYAMFGTDKDTLESLKNEFSDLTFKPTDEKMDGATMLTISFDLNEKSITKINVDENGVFWLNGEVDTYRVSSGSFDYEFVRNIYYQSKPKNWNYYSFIMQNKS